MALTSEYYFQLYSRAQKIISCFRQIKFILSRMILTSSAILILIYQKIKQSRVSDFTKITELWYQIWSPLCLGYSRLPLIHQAWTSNQLFS